MDSSQNQMSYMASLEDSQDKTEESAKTGRADARRQTSGLRQRRPLESLKTARNEHGFSE